MASDMIIRRENRISPLKIRLYRTYRTGRMCCVGRTCRMDRTCRLGEPNPIKRPNPNDWISRRPAARAFTLIELIVVVSILGLLLAITLPVLSSVLGSSTA
jgi:prepilin-type N-terminal cleavage/methylation domain-containing protein